MNVSGCASGPGWEPRRLAMTEPQTAPTDSAPAGLSRRTVMGAAAIIAVGNILSRVLGLVREQTIAATFGATAGTDAYVVARTVAITLYDLLVGSVITAA